MESKSSSCYRHFYMGLIGVDDTPNPSFHQFSADPGICQWFHFEDPRHSDAVR